ncbi:hypothetical protein NQZ68_025295 [Dissostichus eleginoides]|nr:hypothetical protein NQZ68_025295 [Dissostichus eleginoides]
MQTRPTNSREDQSDQNPLTYRISPEPETGSGATDRHLLSIRCQHGECLRKRDLDSCSGSGRHAAALLLLTA